MKNIVIFLILSITLLCTSCDWFSDWGKSNKKEKTELEKLPVATRSGEFTFGCLVNGRAFVVKNSLSMRAIYQRGQLQLGANFEVNNIDQDINMILGDPLEENIYYRFTDSTHHYNAQYRDFMNNSNCWFEFDDTFEGSILFTRIDRAKFIISGKFEFSTVKDDCDTIHITDGRFDLKYIP